MGNKKKLFRIGFMAGVVGLFGLSVTSAMELKINLQGVASLGNQITKKIVPIHFVDNGNDFGGFIYASDGFTPVETFIVESEEEQLALEANKGDFCIRKDEDNKTYVKTSDEKTGILDQDWKEVDDEESDEEIGEMYEVKLGVNGLDPENQVRECGNHVKGFYYNAERGDRLWPLDEEMLKYFSGTGALTGFEGGIYTLCRPGGYSDALEACEANFKSDEDDVDEDEIDGDEVDEEGGDSGQELKACVDAADEKYAQDGGYYGMVTWKLLPEGVSEEDVEDSLETFTLVIGTKYRNASDGGWISIDSEDPALVPNFIRLENRFPIGFVYDYNGGIGFAGCEIKGAKQTVLQSLVNNQTQLKSVFKVDIDDLVTKVDDPNGESVDCKNIGMLGDSLINLIVEGLVGMNRKSDLGIILNQTDRKMQYFSASDIDNATLLNYTKQRAETLCRGKFIAANSANIMSAFNKSSVICLKDGDIDAGLAYDIKSTGKTLILKNGNMTIKPFIGDEASGTGYYDVFISNGNLFIDETNARKFAFTKEGFIVDSNSVVAGEDFQEKIEEDMEENGNYVGDLSSFASFIRGNFIVDGNVKSSSTDGKLHNKYFIHGKFTTKDSSKVLEKLFAWRCTNGYVLKNNGSMDLSQGMYCPPSVYASASLVVIDQNYQSPLYR